MAKEKEEVMKMKENPNEQDIGVDNEQDAEENQGLIGDEPDHKRSDGGNESSESAEHWSEAEENIVEWVNDWEEIKDIIERHAIKGLYQGNAYIGDEKAQTIKQACNILILGCRNSEISQHMYD